jgi:hypothetical protein
MRHYEGHLTQSAACEAILIIHSLEHQANAPLLPASTHHVLCQG